MPFDTTYRFINKDNDLAILTITVSGGKDTTINITNTQLNELVLTHPEIREPVHQYWQSHDPDMKAEKEFYNIMTLLEIVVLIAILGIGYRIHKYWPVWKVALKKKMNAARIVLLLFAVSIITMFFAGNVLLGWPALVFILILVGEFRNELFYPGQIKEAEEQQVVHQNISNTNPAPLKYDGFNLNFTDAEIESALNKRFPYYVAISTTDKERFIYRLKNFIADKTFFIYDKSGYKEMPILIGASAIQLTFGLKNYLLPYFKNIHVYPEEFFRSNNMGICFLEGNVSGNNINLSWKHFLRGYEKSTDGVNVGLHELAHALYYQTFVVGQNVDDNFKNSFDSFIDCGNKAYNTEKTVAGGLYSDYAVTHFQEFWAESAEIYFERPGMLKEMYPSLYEALKMLFKQDLLNDSNLTIS